MAMSEDKPIIVQSDGTILLDVHSPNFESARDDISVFAELIKSPEHIHTYFAYFLVERRIGRHPHRPGDKAAQEVVPL